MRPMVLLVLLAAVSVGLPGCFDVFGSDDDGPTGRTFTYTLVVNAGTSDTIPLYTLNDGERQMEVVAMGFSEPGDPVTVPNPTIRLREGDTLILTVENHNPMPHTLHLHGGLIPWEMDGVPFLTQHPIHQGESFEYVFEDLKAGTYFYHCHVDVAHHMDLGMYGAFIVEEHDPEYDPDVEYVLMLDEWDNCHVHGNLDPITGAEQSGEFSNRAECVERFLQDNLAQNQLVGQLDGNIPPDQKATLCAQFDTLPPEVGVPLSNQLRCDGGHGDPPLQQAERSWYPTTFPVYDPEYNTFLINGKAFPDTVPIIVQEGDTLLLRLINVGEEMHSMHIHGHFMLVTHRDGFELDSPFRVDTLGIMPGERYDVIVEMDNPGYWPFHDHVGLNVMNDDHSPGGMFTCIAYDDFHGIDAESFERALDCFDAAAIVLGGHDHGAA